jgi:PEP-CTERM motif
MLTNVGSDGATQIIQSSSGDTSFSAADRWLVTDDTPTLSDPANLHLLWGTGGLAPNSVSRTVFSSAGSEGVRVDYLLTLAAGQTSSLMMVNQIFGTASAAVGSAAQFDALSASSSLLSDLSAAERNRIVNWRLGSASVPEPSSMLLVGAACLALGAARRRKAA